MSKRQSIFDSVRSLTFSENPDSGIDQEILQSESIDQEISKTLSKIHYNIDACNGLINQKLIPILLNFQKNSRDINDSTRFLKNLFENSLDVNIQVQKKDNANKEANLSAEELAKKVNITDSENNLSESILSNTSQEHVSLDIDQLLRRYRDKKHQDVKEDQATTPTSKKEIDMLFAHRSKTSESTTIDLGSSIIEQNTGTLTLDSERPNRSGYQIQILPRKKQKVEPTTPKRKKSSNIIDNLGLDDSPDDIPKTPELTYLKFSPIQGTRDRKKAQQEVSIGETPQPPSGLEFDESQQATGQLFFNSTGSSLPVMSPPTSLKFALPKLNIHLQRSPIKTLARRYTRDYLDMEVDDESLMDGSGIGEADETGEEGKE